MADGDRNTFYVGCEVLVRKGNSILLGLRKNCYGAGSWGLPAGHLELDERLVDGACREVQEELGWHILPTDLQLFSIAEDPRPQGHYIHVSFELREPAQEPQLMEPESCEEWRYFDLDGLRLDEVFKPHWAIIQNYTAGRLYAVI